MKIKIYTHTTCPYCVGVKQVFKNRNLDFEEIDFIKNPEKKAEFVTLAKKYNFFSVPMVLIDEKFVGGLDETVEFFKKKEK